MDRIHASPIAKMAIKVGKKRQQQLKDLKVALKKEDKNRALEIARELVGLNNTKNATI